VFNEKIFNPDLIGLITFYKRKSNSGFEVKWTIERALGQCSLQKFYDLDPTKVRFNASYLFIGFSSKSVMSLRKVLVFTWRER
jgi:hypothetical protein